MPRACKSVAGVTKIDRTHVKPECEYPLERVEFECNFKRSGPDRDEDRERAVYMDGVITDPPRLYAMTRMTPEEFDLTAHLLYVWFTTIGRGRLMWEDVSRKSDGGNRCKLTVKQALLLVITHKYADKNQKFTGAVFMLSQSTVHRYVGAVDEALAAVLPTADSLEKQIKAVCDE